MLTLAPGCSCDVCAEEYSANRLPYSIACGASPSSSPHLLSVYFIHSQIFFYPGHVLCSPCITQIIEKTPQRLQPVCPFCREPCTAESMRVVRMDFSTSGWSTPRRAPALETFNSFTSEMLQRKTERLLSANAGFNSFGGGGGRKADIARLEDKVSRIAKKKCSVEEVSAVYKELEEFVVGAKDDVPTSLCLSAALLHAILANHHSHSESSKNAKTTEMGLRRQVEDLEGERNQYTSKSQECNQLRQEISQLRALATTLGASVPESLASSRSLSPTPTSTPQSTSPTPYSSGNSGAISSASAQAAGLTPVSRFNSMHSRSLSMSGGRPTTPASPVSPTRSHTPAVSSTSSPRSHTPGPNSSSAPRSHTPGPNSSGMRSHTPGPLSSASAQAAQGLRSLSHTPSIRSATPSLRSYGGQSISSTGGGVPPVPSLPEQPQTRGRATPAPGLSSASAQAAAHAAAQAEKVQESQSQSQSQRHERPPQMMSSASAQAAAHHARMQHSQTPAPIIPPKPRRLSQPSPPKAGLMMRSSSDEKATAAAGGHVLGTGPNQVWVPPKPSGEDMDYVLRDKEREGHSYGNSRGVYGMTSASMNSYGYGQQQQHSSAPTSPQGTPVKSGGGGAFGWFGRSGGAAGEKDDAARGHQRSASVRPPSRMAMGLGGRFVS
ncbi:hypothetical protein CVT24_011501 [Panaeolus cyanescens]|uniref:RING-type domain-containing protein n=1 Tax=Panaeolus cyanescens TaxID=181874 RepID=A0A409VGQ6_9AGAR|nr:hypothetical protein CVT24_011501 [Panaeolus cyanescens]